MSVINQMLNDLDKRQASGRTASPVATAARRQGPSRGLWLMLALSLLIFLLFGLPHYGKKPPRLRDGVSTGQPRTYVLRPAISNDDPNAPADKTPSDNNASSDTAVTANAVAAPAQLTPAQTTQEPSTGSPPAPTDAAPREPESVARGASERPASVPAAAAPITRRQFTVAQPADLPASEASAVASLESSFAPAAAVAFDASREYPSSTDVGDAAVDADAALASVTPITAPKPVMSVERVGAKPVVASRSVQQRQLAQQAMAQQQWSVARELWQSLLQQDPQQVLVYDQLAYVYQQQQDWLALSALQGQAAAHQIRSVPLQIAQLKALAVGQQWAQLLASITPSLQQQGGAVMALKAKAHQELGQPEQALLTYRQWQRQEPTQARAFLGEALVLEQQGQTVAATRAYQQALAMGGLSPDTESFIQQRLLTQGAR